MGVLLVLSFGEEGLAQKNRSGNVENLLFGEFAHVLLLLPCTTKGLELNKTP